MGLPNLTLVPDDHKDAVIADRRLGMFLTLQEAAGELRVDIKAAHSWLAERGLLRTVAGRDLVVPDQLAAAVGAVGNGERLPSKGPLDSWRAVASVLGISEDTVGRHRKEHRDATPCHFLDEEEVRDWWRALHTPAPKPARPRRGRAKGIEPDGALDVKALVRDLTGRP